LGFGVEVLGLGTQGGSSPERCSFKAFPVQLISSRGTLGRVSQVDDAGT
jgi:hypothetical protein